MTENASRQAILPARDSYGSIVHELERVELEARERRLTAASEADRIRTAALATAGEITAGVPERVAAALAKLRARQVDAAEVEVAAINAHLDSAPARSRPGPALPVADAAVDLLVAAVLAEPTAKTAADSTA
jgi:hypothetical protein